MSNKIVPSIYRAVIDDVVASIKAEFDEYGVGEEVLAELQHKWEHKVMASHVAEFDMPAPPQSSQHHPFPPHMHYQPHTHYTAPYAGPPQPGAAPTVKAEPVDGRYMLSGPQGMTYALPPLPGPQLNGGKPGYPGGQQSILSFPSGPPLPGAGPRPSSTQPPRTYAPSASQSQSPQPPTDASASPRPQAVQAPPRIPQTDGPSSESSDSPSPPSSQAYAPHPSHPSLPQPSQSSSKPEDSEAINSDLDDSDTEGEEDADEGGPADTDIVFCTYDKVARVKNKWKCILKDGMIHINGKDYLFAKCTGEFEW